MTNEVPFTQAAVSSAPAVFTSMFKAATEATDKRCAEAQRILKKHPRHVPVICKKAGEKRKKLLVDGATACDKFVDIVRGPKHFGLSHGMRLLATNGEQHFGFLMGSGPVADFYERYGAEDGFLYVTVLPAGAPCPEKPCVNGPSRVVYVPVAADTGDATNRPPVEDLADLVTRSHDDETLQDVSADASLTEKLPSPTQVIHLPDHDPEKVDDVSKQTDPKGVAKVNTGAARMLVKFPDRVPVYTKLGPTGTSKKMLVPRNLPCIKFAQLIRKQIPGDLSTVFIHEEGGVLSDDESMEDLYERYRGEDCFLYVTAVARGGPEARAADARAKEREQAKARLAEIEAGRAREEIEARMTTLQIAQKEVDVELAVARKAREEAEAEKTAARKERDEVEALKAEAQAEKSAALKARREAEASKAEQVALAETLVQLKSEAEAEKAAVQQAKEQFLATQLEMRSQVEEEKSVALKARQEAEARHAEQMALAETLVQLKQEAAGEKAAAEQAKEQVLASQVHMKTQVDAAAKLKAELEAEKLAVQIAKREAEANAAEQMRLKREAQEALASAKQEKASVAALKAEVEAEREEVAVQRAALEAMEAEAKAKEMEAQEREVDGFVHVGSDEVDEGFLLCNQDDTEW